MYLLFITITKMNMMAVAVTNIAPGWTINQKLKSTEKAAVLLNYTILAIVVVSNKVLP